MGNLKKIFLIKLLSLSMGKYGALGFMWHRTKALIRSPRIISTSHISMHHVSTGIFQLLIGMYSLSEIVMYITKSNSVHRTEPHVVLEMSSFHSDSGVDTQRGRTTRRGGNTLAVIRRRSFFNQFPVRTQL
jgi:hypothetical protein